MLGFREVNLMSHAGLENQNFKNRNSSRQTIFPIWLGLHPVVLGYLWV